MTEPTKADESQSDSSSESADAAVADRRTADGVDSQTAAARESLRYQPLVILLAAFCVGVVVDRVHPLAAPIWWTGALALWFVWLLIWRLGSVRVAAVLLLASVALCGASWHHLRWNCFGDDELGLTAREVAAPACIEAVVLTQPMWIPAPPRNPMQTIPRGDKTQLKVRFVGVRDRDQWEAASGRAELAVDGHLLGIRPGDRLRIVAQLYAPSSPDNPGEFDFKRYERGHRKLCGLRAEFPDCVEVIDRGAPWQWRRLLGYVQEAGQQLIWQNVSPQRAGLASALLLGAREQVDSERTENFVVTGTVHLLVISGLHVAILASGLWFIGRVGLLSRRATLLGGIVLVIVYALLTGAAPPVVRASILVIGFCTARLLGRPALSFNLLAGAALVVLAVSPAQLFGAGTQLSFLAAGVLMVCWPWLVPRPPDDPLDLLVWQTRPWPVRWTRKASGAVWRLVAVGAMIWLVAMPLVASRFHLVSPVGVLLTPLLWIPITVALYSGFGALVLGWLCPPVGQGLGWLCDQCLWMIESCVNAARDVPLGHHWVPAPPDWWVVAFYAGLAACVAIPRVRPPRRWLAAIWCAWLAVGLIALLPAGQWTAASTPEAVRTGDPPPIADAPSDRPLVCTFVSVGHGTSVIVELPGGQTLLYDIGCGPSPSHAARATAAVLWSRGITHIDAVVVSHADVDHYNGLPELLDRVSVGAVYVSPVMFEDETPALAALRSAIVDARVPLVEFSSGDRLAVHGGAEIEVLHPPRRGIIGGDNANSIVLRISYAGRHILLPGDLESPGLNDLLAEEPLQSDVVMAPHHGSARSNPQGFAAWSHPRYVVISGGPGADTEAVKRAYRAAGAEVFHTAQQGAVRVVLEADGTIRAQSWRHSPWR